MHRKICLLISTLAVYLVHASSHVLHEKRDTQVSHEWMKSDAAPRDLSLPVRIGMAQSNLDLGAELLMDLSDPKSPSYGRHLSAEQVHDLFAPLPGTVGAVISWLAESLPARKISQSVNKQWIQFEASPGELEGLLKTKYHLWEHLPTGRQTIACDECVDPYRKLIGGADDLARYSIPRHLIEHIDYITPGIKLHMPSPRQASQKYKRQNVAREANSLQERDSEKHPKVQPFHGYKYCAHQMTPQCIQALYNATGNFSAVKGNDIGIFALGDDQFQSRALQAFFNKLYPKIPEDTRPTELFVDNPGSKIPPEDGELALDVQSAYPLIYPQNMTIWYVDDQYRLKQENEYDKTIHNYKPRDIFNPWLDAIDGSYCNYTAFGITGDSPVIDPKYPDHHPGGWDHPLQCGVYKPLNVMSISYYQAESWLPVRFQKRQCSEYLKLGLQGSSIFFCSGDTGASGGSGSPHPLRGANHCLGSNPENVFIPNFPASCPFVTAVGGTELPANSNIFDYPEHSWPSSSGGFSNIWTSPNYQKKAVSTYFKKFSPPYKSYSTKDGKNIGANGGRFNRNGRGYPDVSAVANYVVTVGVENSKGDTSLELSGGTSASTPIWAGLVTRINAARLRAGKKTVGFINPTLYANPEAFHDVTKGGQIGCGETPGYTAEPGWDPVTGLGTPDLGKLEEIFLKLP